MNFDRSARLGAAGSPFVIEADEYDSALFDKRSKFVHYRPRTAILNNLEHDHADIFPDLAAIETTVPPPDPHRCPVRGPRGGEPARRGLGSACSRMRLLEHRRRRLRRQEARTPAVLRARGEPQAFDVLRGSLLLGRVEWELSRRAQPAQCAGRAGGGRSGLGVDLGACLPGRCRVFPATCADAWNCGVHGRRHCKVYDDFAHHPTAIRTTVAGLRKPHQAGNERILALFEPRSNTMKLGTMKAQLP